MNYPNEIIDEYIAQIDSHLSSGTASERREFLADIRAHLREQFGSGEWEAADVLNALERFGDPAEIAREFRESTGHTTPERSSHPPTWLVLALTILLWPIGIVLAWLSPAWKTRSKIIATLIVILAFGFVFIGSAVTFAAYTSTSSPQAVHQVTQPAAGNAPVISSAPSLGISIANALVLRLVFLLCIGSPLLSGVYLAVTRQPGF